MTEPKCNDCLYYLRHYTLDSRKIFRVHCGHCIFGRPMHKLPDAKICKKFISRPPQEEAFVSKEYLSKELLEYVLRMELLPEISINPMNRE